MRLVIVFAVSTLFLVQPVVGQEDVCPKSNQDALKKVQSFLTDTDDSDLRQELGITVAPDQVRALKDSRDAEACRQLAKKHGGGTTQDPFFYRAGEYYFVVYRKVRQNSDGTVSTHPTPFIILDNNFRLLKILI